MTRHTDVPTDLEALRDDLTKVKEDLASLVSSLVDSGRASARAVGDKVTSSAEAVEHFVEERPVTTAMIAFGGGLLAGMLLCRK